MHLNLANTKLSLEQILIVSTSIEQVLIFIKKNRTRNKQGMTLNQVLEFLFEKTLFLLYILAKDPCGV